MTIREQLNQSIKDAMIRKDKVSLQTLRMLSAALKQIEVDKRIEITDEIAIREFVRQSKQRQDAAKQYRDAGRSDLAEQEENELKIIQGFLPEAVSEEEMRQVVDQIVDASDLPQEMSSMGGLMAKIKPALEGKADMAQVSQYLRSKLKP